MMLRVAFWFTVFLLCIALLAGAWKAVGWLLMAGVFLLVIPTGDDK